MDLKRKAKSKPKNRPTPERKGVWVYAMHPVRWYVTLTLPFTLFVKVLMFVGVEMNCGVLVVFLWL